MNITAFFDVYSTIPMTPLVPAPRTRSWMPPFAYRCLPMVLANEAGWLALCPTRISAEWNGGGTPDDMVITEGEGSALSHFGHGILTFNLTFLFRTPPGWDTLIRGPSNFPKHGIAPCEGIVETDTATETATMNWMFTAPGGVRFEKGEPFAMIVPQHRGWLDAFDPEYVSIEEDQELGAHLRKWSDERIKFIEENHGGAPKKQGDYANKVTQRKLALSEWRLREEAK